ncbi:unnamed protein product, partial [Coregonus sp. 'balchen']
PQQSEAVYQFCVSVNPSVLIELDPRLGDCVLRDPLKATALFQSYDAILRVPSHQSARPRGHVDGHSEELLQLPALLLSPLKRMSNKHLVELIHVKALDVLKVHPPSALSSNFQALLTATASSSWRFSAIVANSSGSAVVPPGLYSSLKLCLLLGLVQGRGDNPDSLHRLDLLALTSDTFKLDRYYISSFIQSVN